MMAFFNLWIASQLSLSWETTKTVFCCCSRSIWWAWGGPKTSAKNCTTTSISSIRTLICWKFALIMQIQDLICKTITTGRSNNSKHYLAKWCKCNSSNSSSSSSNSSLRSLLGLMDNLINTLQQRVLQTLQLHNRTILIITWCTNSNLRCTITWFRTHNTIRSLSKFFIKICSSYCLLVIHKHSSWCSSNKTCFSSNNNNSNSNIVTICHLTNEWHRLYQILINNHLHIEAFCIYNSFD